MYGMTFNSCNFNFASCPYIDPGAMIVFIVFSLCFLWNICDSLMTMCKQNSHVDEFGE